MWEQEAKVHRLIGVLLVTEVGLPQEDGSLGWGAIRK